MSHEHEACLRLWRAVLCSVLVEARAAHAKALRGGQATQAAAIVEGTRRYLKSANCRRVAHYADVTVNV